MAKKRDLESAQSGEAVQQKRVGQDMVTPNATLEGSLIPALDWRSDAIPGIPLPPGGLGGESAPITESVPELREEMLHRLVRIARLEERRPRGRQTAVVAVKDQVH